MDMKGEVLALLRLGLPHVESIERSSIMHLTMLLLQGTGVGFLAPFNSVFPMLSSHEGTWDLLKEPNS